MTAAPLPPLAAELVDALSSEAHFWQWLASRGYVPSPVAIPVPDRSDLQGASHCHAPAHAEAPFLLVQYDDRLGQRQLGGGAQLRERQRLFNAYWERLRIQLPDSSDVPRLAVIASPTFLVAFELNGDAYAPRVRLSPERLERTGSPLEDAFRKLSAPTLSTWRRVDDLFGDADWDLKSLFAGAVLDDAFVRQMDRERVAVLRVLMAREHRTSLLAAVWKVLGPSLDVGPELPSLRMLARNRNFRGALVATVDTVLLRFVLYRYLEAQFGHALDRSEQEGIAFGSFDELIERTTRVDRQKVEAAGKATGKKSKKVPAAQGELFVTMAAPAEFKDDLGGRTDWYQRQAGGDLHHGALADAASVLQDWLQTHRPEVLGELLAVTSASEWSFHYADLDPRALQRFYETTIGTDLKLSVVPSASGGEDEIHVDVVDFHRNRKEQGAFYTAKALCDWLVERTLGRTLDAAAERLEALATVPAAEVESAARQELDAVTTLTVVDPTCGGGMFLASAFDLFARRRNRLAEALGIGLRPFPGALERLTASGPGRLFAADTPSGDWEWHVLLRMLYGVDVDVKAVNVASNLLTLSALTYKRHGVCFPSFIHTNLKPGNALVSPVKVRDRADVAREHGPELRRLLDLRALLRDTETERQAWLDAHAEARKLSAKLTATLIPKAWRGQFDGLGDADLVARVRRVGVFVWEVEFPEVFYEAAGDGVALKARPGFDVVVGNPPWEEPAAEFKQFLPEFDPEYKSLSGPASKAREDELLADPEILARWGEFCTSVEDYKALLTTGGYEHQRRKVKGKIPGAHTNLYKYAVERSWQILREHGRAGLVLDGGLWSDLAASGLRKLLLEDCSSVEVAGFSNNEGLFPEIHRSYKFSGTVFERGSPEDDVRAVFMLADFGVLHRFSDVAVKIPIATVREDARDSYPIPEIRSVEHWEAERVLSRHPTLDSDEWSISILAEELNAGRQRHYFETTGSMPVLQGAQFNLFGVHQGEAPDAWLSADGQGFVRDRQLGRTLDAIADALELRSELSQGGRRRDHATAWLQACGLRAEEVVRLDWEGFRLAWRDIARNDDHRTMICAVLPKSVGVTHTVPYVRPFRLEVNANGVSYRSAYSPHQLLYLCSLLSSFSCDAMVRGRLAKTHLLPSLFCALPVPAWNDDRECERLAILCARLTCLPATPERPWADYRDLAASVGLDPARDGLIDPLERREAEIELNALAAARYGLSRKKFRFLMDTLFMTPKHKETHAALRDAVSARLEERP